jgi:hypothetical protein
MRARGGDPEAFSSAPHGLLAVLDRGSAEPIGVYVRRRAQIWGLSEVGEGKGGRGNGDSCVFFTCEGVDEGKDGERWIWSRDDGCG